MSWHCFPGSSVLGCLRLRHVPAKLESGACWNWNIITTKQDYLEQRFQMGLEMTLCYSEIISHSSSGGWEKCQAWHTFLGGMVLASRHLASTLTHPPLLGNTGHCPALGRWPPGTRASTHQKALLWGPMF